MAKTRYQRTGLTGGGASNLDGIDGALLNDGDYAFVMDSSNSVYIYVLDTSSGATEDSPSVISPDSNPGSKRWLLQKFFTFSYQRTGLTGGTSADLDGIDGALLNDGDYAFVMDGQYRLYIYVLHASWGGNERAPFIIKPDDNAGNKRWILQYSKEGGEFYADPSEADHGSASVFDFRTAKDFIDYLETFPVLNPRISISDQIATKLILEVNEEKHFKRPKFLQIAKKINLSLDLTILVKHAKSSHIAKKITLVVT